MRFTLPLLLSGLCALACAIPVQQSDKQSKIADKAFLQKQKDLLRLFKNVFQSNYYKDQAEIAKSYQIEEHMDMYANQQYLKEFLSLYKEGLLPRGAAYSIFYGQQRTQSIALFHILYSAKDWETFYKTACWAREHVNEGMFVYAMHVAILHRQDTQGIVLPPIYEINPYLFVNSEVIDKAYEYKMKFSENSQQNKFYINANYSGWYLNNYPEQYDLSYFTEDVGLNAYYYYYNLDYPYWMDGEEYGLSKDRRGELFYFTHEQLLARYYLERLSNNQGGIPVFDWKEPIKTGYVPSMRYPNGLEFPVRPADAHLVNNPHHNTYTHIKSEDNLILIQDIEDYERRIRDSIDLGYVITEDGKKIDLYNEDSINILGNVIQSNPDSVNNRFYGYLQVLASYVLGYGFNHVEYYKPQPSVLEHFETALRDPMFYQLFNRINLYFLKYKEHLPHYNDTELNYPGVQIEKVHVDKLITYFDTYDFEISNALYMNEQEFQQDNIQVWARQHRLNHKPFTYKIDVQSEKDDDVVVRVFLGPKFDEEEHEIEMTRCNVNFVELDKFVYTLQAGKNVIERNSHQGETVKDRTTYRELYKHVLSALEGKEEFHLDKSEAYNGFPNRFRLPKGKVEGQVYQFYVYIGPYTKKVDQNKDHSIPAGVGSGVRYIDDMPFGFPFDRPVYNKHTFFVPNSYIEDVVVFHKTEKEINTSAQ